MKKIIISLALLISVGNIMAQTPEEKAALIELVQKALNTKAVEEKKLGETYKMIADFAQPINNVLIGYASSQNPLDTLLFYNNLQNLTDGIHNELKYTKVVKGEGGNEAYLKAKKLNLKDLFYRFW